MDKRTTILVIDDTKSMHQYWHERRDLFTLYIDNLHLRSAYTINRGRQLLEELGMAIDAIAIDACVPGNRINSDHFVRWLRENIDGSTGLYRNKRYVSRFEGPIIAITDIPVYQDLMKQAGCSHACGKYQLLDTIVSALSVGDKKQATPVSPAKKSSMKKTRNEQGYFRER